MINLLVARSKNNVIGTADNNLPWHLPADMAYFKKLTANSTVIMGKNTFLSLPFKNGLPKRSNIVVSKSLILEDNSEVIVVGSIEEAIKKAKSIGQKVWVIGGGVLYRDALEKNLIDYYYVTEVETVVFGRELPRFEFNKSEFKLVSSNLYKKDSKNKFNMEFNVYKKLR